MCPSNYEAAEGPPADPLSTEFDSTAARISRGSFRGQSFVPRILLSSNLRHDYALPDSAGVKIDEMR